MAIPYKYKRLVLASQRFQSFSHFVDLLTIGLFTCTALLAVNKILPKKILDHEMLNLSWSTLGICAGLFVLLFVSQLSRLNLQRELSAFEREATIKAARRNRY